MSAYQSFFLCTVGTNASQVKSGNPILDAHNAKHA